MGYRYTVKSCGKAHPVCNKCQPGFKGSQFNWTEEGKERHRIAHSKPMSENTKEKISKGISKAYEDGRHVGWKIARTKHLESELHISGKCKCNGWKHSLESREKMALSTAKQYESKSFFNKRTKLEKALALLLDEAGLEYEEQIRFGKYVVDFWIPEIEVVFEADGMFWSHHQDKEREMNRDNYLLNKGVSSVVHLTDTDLLPWTRRVI